MTDQFDVIEVGERDRRRPIGLFVVLVLLAVSVVGLIVSRRADPPAPPGEEPGQEPVPVATASLRPFVRTQITPNAVHPETSGKGDVARMRVVFPDGTRATVRYPAELHLDVLGVRPFQGVWVDGRFRQLVAPFGGEAEITRGGEPIRSFADNVTLWPRQPGSGSFGQVLLYSFDRWRIALYDRQPGLEFDQRVAVAEGLRGRVVEDGYLVLSGSERVRLAEPGDQERGAPVGPQLWFGGGASDMVALIPTPDCAEARGMPWGVRGRGHPVREVCRDGMRVVVMGDEEFMGKALDGIRVTVK